MTPRVKSGHHGLMQATIPRTLDDPGDRLAARLRATAFESPQRVAIRLKVADGYAETTYGEFLERATALAQGLVARGLRLGDRVAILSENRPEWAIAFVGIYLAGGIVVPLDPQLSAAEWRRLIEDSDSRFVFVSQYSEPRLEDILCDTAAAGRTIGLDSGGLDRLQGEGVAARNVLPDRDLGETLTILYTSGTTGVPKGVMLSEANVTFEIRAVLATFSAGPDDNLLCLLPLHHILPLAMNLLTPLWMGAQVTFADTLKRAEILAALESAGVTILVTVPQFFYMFQARIHEELSRKPTAVRRVYPWLLRLNRHATRLGIPLGRLLFGRIHALFGRRLRLFVSGGSAFDPAVAQEFHDLGFTILQGYGLTETTGAATATRVEDNVIGSVGPPLPGVETRILDPDESGIGEVAIRGGSVMQGYWRRPDATAESLRDGWFLSGDLGRFDARGHLHITGRKKEVIVLPNGKNIYPDELEAHYGRSPFIAEIAIVGITEPGGTATRERLHGVVVPDFERLRERKIANAREILRDEIARLAVELPSWKRLLSYEIRQEPLPRTTTRKIRRLELAHEASSAGSGPVSEGFSESAEDRRLRGSISGRELLRSLTEHHGRHESIDLGMNLELDLGFDSMERVELLTGLDSALGLTLPDGFGADLFTVRDLIRALDALEQTAGAEGRRGRQTWAEILSPEALAASADSMPRFTGRILRLPKVIALRLLRLMFRVFLQLEVRGLDRLPRDGAYLICPNHQSYLDTFVVMSVMPWSVLRRVFFVGYAEFFQNPAMRLVARLTNIVPVDPDAHLLRAMKIGAQGLRDGHVLCLFPEGGRTLDGELTEFKKGAAILAREVGIPIVPVAIAGLWEVWPRTRRRIRLHPVRIAFGEPIRPASDGPPDYEGDTRRLRAAIEALLEGIRFRKRPDRASPSP